MKKKEEVYAIFEITAAATWPVVKKTSNSGPPLCCRKKICELE